MKLLVQFRVEDGIVGKSEYEIVSQWQTSSARMLAIAEAGQESLKFLNRQGVLQANMRLLYPIQSLCWNRDGEYLAIVFQPRQSRVWVVNARSKQYDEYDMGRQLHATFMMWCRNHDLLAVCSSKGHTFIFDHARKDNQCFMTGKHERGVVAGDWSSNNLFATISEDKCVSVIDLQGNTVCNFEHTATHATSLKFPQAKSNAFALVLASKVLLLCQLPANTGVAAANGHVKDARKSSTVANQQQASQVRLSFDTSYGDIVDFYWHQEDFIIIAFSKGYVIEVSTRADEISTELWHCQVFAGRLNSFAMIPSFSLRPAIQQTIQVVTQQQSSSSSSAAANSQHKFAVSDGNVIKIFDARSPNTPQATLQEQTESNFTRLDWSCDGELLMAIGNSGQCYLYLSSIKQLGSAYFTQFAYLAGGVGEVMVADEVVFPAAHSKLPHQQQNDFEPSVLGIGPSMMIAAANNFVHYYNVLTPAEVRQIERQLKHSAKQYTSSNNVTTFRIEHIHVRQFYHEVVSIVLNAYVVAFLFDNGKVLVHSLPPSSSTSIMPFIVALNNSTNNKLQNIRLNDDFIDETSCVFPDSFRSTEDIAKSANKNLQLFSESSPVQFTCVESSSEYIAIGADDGTVFLFSCLDTLHIGPIAQFQHTSSAVKLALHPRLPIVVVIDMIGHVVLFDALNDVELPISVLSSSAANTINAQTSSSAMMRARGALFNCGRGVSSVSLMRNAAAAGDHIVLRDDDGGSGEDCSFIVYDDREAAVLLYRFDSVDGPRLIDVRAALANALPTYEATSAVLASSSSGADRTKMGDGGKKSVSESKTCTLPRFSLPLAFYNATVWVLRQDGQLFARRLDNIYPSDIAERVLATVTIKESEIVETFPWSGVVSSSDGVTAAPPSKPNSNSSGYEGRRNLIDDIRKCVALRKERQALRLISILLKTDAAYNIDLLPSGGGSASTTSTVATGGTNSTAAAATISSSYSATSVATAQLLQAIAKQFVEELQLEAAVYTYRQLRQAAYVWQLEEIITSCADDRLVMKATVAMLLKRFDDAEHHYLQAQQPEAALQMRCNLLDWARGSQLAKECAPKQLPLISYQYGMQLEFSGDYANALTQFERGLIDNGDVQNAHNRKCYAGIARTCARINNVQRALGICAKLQDSTLSAECAQQMEAANAFSEAGQLYESIQQYERAAATYIRAKDWSKLQAVLFVSASAPVVQEAAARPSTAAARRSVVVGGQSATVANPAVRNPQLFQAYAKRQEDVGKFDEACRAYEAGGYYEDVVRLFLRENVNKIDQAVKLVEQRRSRGAALLLANYLAKQRNDVKAALRLLVHVGCDEEAFKFAQQHSLVHVYADVIGTQASTDIYKSIALYFEGEQRNNIKAGKFFLLAGMQARAVRVVLRELTSPQTAAIQQPAGVDSNKASQRTNETLSHQDEAMRVLVQAAVQSNEKSLVTQVESFLLGQLDGVARDPYYLYRLYVESKAYREAGKTAVVVARHHVQDSEYDKAHDLLRATCTELITTSEKFFIPLELRQLLLMLHSRKLAVLHSRLGDFQLAAHLLKRIVDNVSLFPQQDGEKLLWSYYTICGKAQFKVAAYEMAKRLNEMQRQKSEAAKAAGNNGLSSNNVELPEKYRNAIFQTLRRGNPLQAAGGGTNDPTLDDEMCIFAWSARALDIEPRDFSHSFSPLLLTCPHCENTLPFCSLTGLRMTLDNFGLCGKCMLPVTYSKAIDFLMRSSKQGQSQQQVPHQCPMCNAEWTISETVDDASSSTTHESEQPSVLRKLTRKQVFDCLERNWVSSTTTTAVAPASAAAAGPTAAVRSNATTGMQREKLPSSSKPTAAVANPDRGALLERV